MTSETKHVWVYGGVSEMGFLILGDVYFYQMVVEIILRSYLWVHNDWRPCDTKLWCIRLGENGVGNLANFQCLLKIHASIVNIYWGKLMPFQITNQRQYKSNV